MKSDQRAELSPKNPYYLERHRYYELKHFCLQYPIWKKARAGLIGLAERPEGLEAAIRSGISDPVPKIAEARIFYSDRIEMLEKAAKETDPVLWIYILHSVTQGLSYDKINAGTNVPCCRETFYILYRKFFWILNKLRM